MVLIRDVDQEARTEAKLPPFEEGRFDATRVGIGGFNKEFAPIDDVCPICFGSFSLPCRSNCGHWFCASCILEFWMYRTSILPCTCPLCSSPIVNLKAEASQLIQQADNDVDALKKVQQYNSLYSRGLFHRVRGGFPILAKKMFNVLIDPEHMRSLYYVLRLFGIFLAILYNGYECEFVPAGSVGIRRMFDKCASVLVVLLFCISIAYRWTLGDRLMHLVADHLDSGMIFFVFAFVACVRINLNLE